jgi:methionine synthase II (cobalamin-independent)
LKKGASLADFRIDNLFYADIARESYAVFRRLKQRGKIAPDVRFQVDLVPAHSVIWLFVVNELQPAIDPIYNEALGREIDKIAASIPHQELAIQFDVASAVFARLQRGETGTYGDTKEAMEMSFTEILARLANRVPSDIELLFHFCYGDSNHRHVVEPKDMGDMVEMAHRLFAAVKRPVNLIHMPVPRNRSDDAYFQPLRQLKLSRETELALGLVHYTDGLEGTQRRLETARKYARNFAIGTECGFGRRKPETIPGLLRIHAEAAAMA